MLLSEGAAGGGGAHPFKVCSKTAIKWQCYAQQVKREHDGFNLIIKCVPAGVCAKDAMHS